MLSRFPTSLPPNIATTMQTYKVVLAGNSGVGKSTFVSKLRRSSLAPAGPTIGCEVHPIVLHTDAGDVCLNIWDLAGREALGGLRFGYYTGADAAIYMYDASNHQSLVGALKWEEDSNLQVPSIFVANKADTDEIYLPEDKRSCSLSSTSDPREPLLSLVESLLGRDSVACV